MKDSIKSCFSCFQTLILNWNRQVRATHLVSTMARLLSSYNAYYMLLPWHVFWLHTLIPWQPRHRQAESPDMEFTQVACGAAHTCALSIATCQKASMSKNDEGCWWQVLWSDGPSPTCPPHLSHRSRMAGFSAGAAMNIAEVLERQMGGRPSQLALNLLNVDAYDLCWRFVSIAASGGHSCALKKSGEALCWGFNVA